MRALALLSVPVVKFLGGAIQQALCAPSCFLSLVWFSVEGLHPVAMPAIGWLNGASSKFGEKVRKLLSRSHWYNSLLIEFGVMTLYPLATPLVTAIYCRSVCGWWLQHMRTVACLGNTLINFFCIFHGQFWQMSFRLWLCLQASMHRHKVTCSSKHKHICRICRFLMSRRWIFRKDGRVLNVCCNLQAFVYLLFLS